MNTNQQPIRFVHISDLHLGLKFNNASFSASKGDARRRELIETLYRVIDYVAERQIDFLLISGDAFESKYIGAAQMADINYNFARIADCRIVIISGNHDPLAQSKLYDAVDWQPNVHIIRREFDRLTFDDKRCCVTGSVFYNEEKAPLNFADLPAAAPDYYNILMLHGNVFNDDRYCYIDKAKLLALDYDYIALGHIHKPQFIAPHIAYAGSLEPLNFGEVGEHGFVLGQLGATAQFDFVPFSKRRFIKVEVALEPSDVMTSIVEKIRRQTADLTDDLVRIKLTGYRRYDLTIERAALADALDLYYFELDDQTKIDISIDAVVAANQGGFIGEFAACFTADELADEVFQTAYQQGITMLYEEQNQHEN